MREVTGMKIEQYTRLGHTFKGTQAVMFRGKDEAMTAAVLKSQAVEVNFVGERVNEMVQDATPATDFKNVQSWTGPTVETTKKVTAGGQTAWDLEGSGDDQKLSMYVTQTVTYDGDAVHEQDTDLLSTALCLLYESDAGNSVTCTLV